MQQVGIEPTTSGVSSRRSKPLSYSCEKWPETDLNRRHGNFQSPALPTELSGRVCERYVCTHVCRYDITLHEVAPAPENRSPESSGGTRGFGSSAVVYAAGWLDVSSATGAAVRRSGPTRHPPERMRRW